MLRSIAELAAYGTFAALLTAASLSPGTAQQASSASIGNTATTTSTPTLGRPSTRATERGALLFAVKGCIGCHTQPAFPNAHMQVGPDLTGLAGRAGSRVADLDAEAYVRQALQEPGAYRAMDYVAVMPDLHLSEEEVQSLTAFLLSTSR